MQNARLALGFTILLVLMAFIPSAAAPKWWLLDQKVTVDNVAAQVSVIPAGPDYAIEVHFESSSYPVGCLSAYRDLHYELRDSNGRIIPVDPQTLAYPPYERQVVEHATTSMAGKPPRPCAQNAPGGVWNVRAFSRTCIRACRPENTPCESALRCLALRVVLI